MIVDYCRGALLAIFVILSIAGATALAENNWIRPANNPGDWLDAGNWSEGVPNSPSGWAVVSNGGAAVITSDIRLRSLRMNSGTVELHSGAVTFSADVPSYIAQTGRGTFLQTGGSLSHNDYVYIGYEQASSGKYMLENGVANFQTLHVGFNGSGTFIQESGTVKVSQRLGLGESDKGVGTYELRGGTLNLYSSYGGVVLAYNGQGNFIQTGGTTTVHSANLEIGYWAGSGRYEMSNDAVLNVDRDLTLGRYGNASGTFTQTGGTTTVGGTLHIGHSGWGTQSLCEIAGGSFHAKHIVFGSGGISSTLRISGSATITANTYSQSSLGTLHYAIGTNGIGTIELTGVAELAGDLLVTDLGAGIGRYRILEAAGGITGSFSNVALPGSDWSYGITGGELWVELVPEPATLSLLIFGGLAVLRRKREWPH